jgi:hypothetical protein
MPLPGRLGVSLKVMRHAASLLPLLSTAAVAYPFGIAGYSGEFGHDCNYCHSGGATPTVQLAGPMTLDAGDTGTFTLTITGGSAQVGGLDVSTDNFLVQLQPGLNQQLLSGEVTHISATPFSGNQLVFTFQAVAPASDGTFTLYGAGNSCNGDNLATGDAAAHDTFAVTVVGGGTAPDAGEVLVRAIEPSANGHGDLLGRTATGCSSAGASPLALGALATLAARARRRAQQR